MLLGSTAGFWLRKVSIRARPRGRAMHGVAWRRHPIGRVSIRARPRGRAMRLPGTHIRTSRRFQSAPGLEAGRCAARIAPLSLTPCFNPRPA